MYNLQPYDLSKNFKLIPNHEKYTLTFCQNSSVNFKSKKDAFAFISKISNFFLEVLQLSEMIQMSINNFRYHITPTTKANSDKYNVFVNNDLDINKTISDLKHFRNSEKELYKLELKYHNLLIKLFENVEILYKKIPTAVSHIFILIDKIYKSFSLIVGNPAHYYNTNSLTIFKI